VAKLKFGSPESQNDMREVSFPDTMRNLFAHKVAFIVVFSITVAAGIVLSILPRSFEATGTVWVEPGESSAETVSALSSILNGQTSDIIASEVDALQSRTLFMRVAKELDLVNNKTFWGVIPFSEPDPDERTLDNAKTRDEVYKRMSHIFDIENNGKDEVISIYATTSSPQLSAKLVNTLINDYLESLFLMRYTAVQRSSKWLLDQLGDLKKKIDSDQEELTRLQEKLGIVGLTPGSSNYLYGESLAEMMKASDAATVERIVAEAKLRFLKESDPNLIEGEVSLLPQATDVAVPTQSLLETLRASQAQASANYARLASLYGPKYPEVLQQKAVLDDLNKQVTLEQSRIVNQAQIAFNAAKANESMASTKVQTEKSTVFDSRDSMVRFIRLMQDYNSDRTLYEALIAHLHEAGITAGLEAGDIDIVDLADVPGKPTILGPLIYIPSGIVLGLILAVFFALWLSTLDQRIKGPEQVTEASGLPLLAQLPHIKPSKVAADKGGTHHLVVSARRSHYAEAMQSLRTSLLLTKPGSPPKVILVTSATPREGKSTTAANLAATFALHGSRVLIADCDLRRGSVAKRLRLSSAKGLTNVLTNQMTLQEAFQEVPDVPGMFLLADGPSPPEPAVLTSSDEMRKIIEECRQLFDYVIIDSPPILGISDGLHLGKLADSVILIIRENMSNRKAVFESASVMLSLHLPVAGFVFNDVDLMASGYAYGYAYRQYYSGYYRDDSETSK
jgi:succinoglycan biosynthesis transport protein ExoP